MQTSNAGITHEQWAGFGKVVKHYGGELVVIGIVLMVWWHWYGRTITGYFGTPPKQAIVIVMQENLRLNREYGAEVANIQCDSDETTDRYAQLTSNFAEKLMAIDLSSCPANFQEAYAKHRDGWSNLALILKNHPHIRTGDEAFFEGMMRALTGDPTGGAIQVQSDYEAFEKQYQAGLLALRESSKEEEAVVGKYGVKPVDVAGQ